MLSELFLLLVGFAILISGSLFLVHGASGLARRFNISSVAIGLTVVAFGTATPEFVVSLYASLKSRDELAFANIIGSNLFNLLFVLGISGGIFPLILHRNTVRIEIPLSLVAATLLYILVNDAILWDSPQNQLDRLEAVGLLVVFGGFMYYMYKSLQYTFDYEDPVKLQSTAVATGGILLGVALLIGGGMLTVDNAVLLSGHFGLPQRFVGLTILAIGTSLPELTTAISAAYKKNTDIAIGNVIGSNIFNILFTLGVSAFVQPMPYQTALNGDMELLGISTIVLLFFMFGMNQRKLDRWEAFVLMAGYVLYIGYRIRADLPDLL